MKTYIWVTFAVMGWGYYELSGGADFVPETVAIAEAQEDTPEVVTRAQTPTLLAVSTSNVIAEPETADVDVTQAVAQALALDTVEAAPEVVETQPEIADVVATQPPVDIREVAGSRVNMRMGPGTNFDVITTLDGGTKLEILDVNEDGWANVAVVDRGLEGWMAERLLTDSDI